MHPVRPNTRDKTEREARNHRRFFGALPPAVIAEVLSRELDVPSLSVSDVVDIQSGSQDNSLPITSHLSPRDQSAQRFRERTI